MSSMRCEFIVECLKLVAVGTVMFWLLMSLRSASTSAPSAPRWVPGMRVAGVCMYGAANR